MPVGNSAVPTVIHLAVRSFSIKGSEGEKGLQLVPALRGSHAMHAKQLRHITASGVTPVASALTL
jgi:hypothetical protein